MKTFVTQHCYKGYHILSLPKKSYNSTGFSQITPFGTSIEKVFNFVIEILYKTCQEITFPMGLPFHKSLTWKKGFLKLLKGLQIFRKEHLLEIILGDLQVTAVTCYDDGIDDSAIFQNIQRSLSKLSLQIISSVSVRTALQYKK